MNFNKNILGLVIILVLSAQIDSTPINEYKFVLEYLESFGYLTTEEIFELTAFESDQNIFDQKQFIRALENFQVSSMSRKKNITNEMSHIV